MLITRGLLIINFADPLPGITMCVLICVVLSICDVLVVCVHMILTGFLLAVNIHGPGHYDITLFSKLAPL